MCSTMHVEYALLPKPACQPAATNEVIERHAAIVEFHSQLLSAAHNC